MIRVNDEVTRLLYLDQHHRHAQHKNKLSDVEALSGNTTHTWQENRPPETGKQTISPTHHFGKVICQHSPAHDKPPPSSYKKTRQGHKTLYHHHYERGHIRHVPA